MSALLRIATAAGAAVLTLIATFAVAHEMTIAEMEMRQIARTEFTWQWVDVGNRPAGSELTPAWPDGCRAESNVVRCGDAGLQGAFSVDGVGKRYSAAMVKVHWMDGQTRVYTVTAGQPTVRLYGSADDARGWLDIATAYTTLGIEHILTGIDHLFFVLSLLFLVSFKRRLLWTITAFTVAHSVTLALCALGWLVLRPPPVEATIALSIVLVAAEALHSRDTFTRRWPTLVAFLFGLAHGLGFAGALKEIGLPENYLSVALLTFNVGVELGQLLVVALAYIVYRLVVALPRLATARVPALYTIGSVAAYWTIGRVFVILG